MPALAPGVIDVPLSPPNQIPSGTMGPLGRLSHLVDGQVSHYEPQYGGTTGITPAKIQCDQRDAFVSLPTVTKSVDDGTNSFVPWTPAEILASLGAQLISIADGQPRVYSGTDWRTYPGTRVLSNQLDQTVFHTSQRTIQAPTDAWMNGVTCSVWTESVTLSTGPTTTSYVGFKSDNGAWVVIPRALFVGSTPNTYWSAQVVEDGSHFFVFFNSSATVVTVNCYDIDGALLNSTTINVTSAVTGHWDIVASPTPSPHLGTVIFASTVAVGTDSGVAFTSVGFASGAITKSANTDATIHCDGPLAWIRNDLTNGLAYLSTCVHSDSNSIWGYEITSLAQTHEFNSGQIVDDEHELDSITGYAFFDITIGVSITLSVGQLPAFDAPYTFGGPPLDPAFRSIFTVECGRNGTNVVLRTTQSVCQVSKAFPIDGEYYVFAYYQSGSGIGLVPRSESVTITSGDYMIGAPVQPITVNPGDSVEGSPVLTVGVGGSNSVNVTTAQGSTGITAGLQVQLVSAPDLSFYGIPAGTPLLHWVLHGFSGGGVSGSRLTLTASSIAGLNTTFDIVYSAGGTDFYTPVLDIGFNLVNPGTGIFTATGHYTITSSVQYSVTDLSPYILAPNILQMFAGGTFVVSGASTGNNGPFNTQSVYYGTSGTSIYSSVAPYTIAFNPAMGNQLPTVSRVFVPLTTQSQAADSLTAVLNPNSPNRWALSNGDFDPTYIGTDLVVTDTTVPSNTNTYPVTAVSASTLLTTGGATSILGEFFTFPYPQIAIQLTTQQQYSFFFASLTPDYTYLQALISVQGAVNPANNGVYQIISIGPGNVLNTIQLNGLSNQVNEAFTNAQTITIFFSNNISPEFQPTWFLVPLTGTQPVVGRFEYGLAYADWRIETNPNLENLFQMALSAPVLTNRGFQVMLPYRAQNVTAATLEQTSAGEVTIVSESFVSTVGLKAFTLSTAPGRPFSGSGELAIPGPMATVFTPSGFLEDGINLAPEAPFLVDETTAASGQLGLTPGGIYFVVAVEEYTDENGNRSYSPPSPALQVSMSGTNNVAVYGGRLQYPLNTSGLPVANQYGVTTKLSGISLYRSAFINGVPTTQHYKITDDLNVNGLAPLTTLNPSGFSFPDLFTWNYTDQNTDAGLNANEILYTDKSLLPRFPCPAFKSGISNPWQNREWVIGYDDAVWFSGEKTAGDAIWFNPAFRIEFPSTDPPKALAALEGFLVVFCTNSIWYIPASQLPDATGGNGSIPTPILLPFQNGSANGFAETIREGAVYDSTAGGVWVITRSLENKWLSHNIFETLTGKVIGMALDESQRLFVLQEGSQTICVYDGIPGSWYEWNSPTQGVLLASYLGQAAYQDEATVNVVTPGTTADTVNGVTTGIAGPDVSVADMIFGNVRGLKRVWEIQGVGTYRGPHGVNVELSYPEDDSPVETFNEFDPSADEPYVIPFNPKQEEASVYAIRFFPDFDGIESPGATFSLEMFSAQVGLDPIGLNKRPQFVTLKAK